MQIELLPEVAKAAKKAKMAADIAAANRRIAERFRANRAHRITCPKRGEHNRRILFSRVEGDREISFHATKGWRVNRKS